MKSLNEISLTKGEYGGGFSAVEYYEGAPRYVRITDVNEDGSLNEKIVAPSGSSDEWDKFKLVEGDLLFARSGATVGKTYLYTERDGNCIYAGYLIRFRPDKSLVDPKYLFYSTKTPSYRAWIENKQNVVAQPNINAKQYGNELQIPLPPLDQQKKIAAILETADAYRQKTKALLAKYDELTQSLFLNMFGDPVTNPKGWQESKMSEACSKVTDGTHDTPERLTEGIKFITGKHIRPYAVDYYNSDYVTEKVHEEIYRRCNPELGDVLYTNIGANLGTAALNKVDYEFSMKNVALLKPHASLITGRYIEYFLNSKNMNAKIVWIGSLGGAQQFLSLTQIRRLKVNTPPLDLQNQFAERVQAIEVQKAQAQESLDKAEDLFNSLLQRAFKGELV